MIALSEGALFTSLRSWLPLGLAIKHLGSVTFEKPQPYLNLYAPTGLGFTLVGKKSIVHICQESGRVMFFRSCSDILILLGRLVLISSCGLSCTQKMRVPASELKRRTPMKFHSTTLDVNHTASHKKFTVPSCEPFEDKKFNRSELLSEDNKSSVLQRIRETALATLKISKLEAIKLVECTARKKGGCRKESLTKSQSELKNLRITAHFFDLQWHWGSRGGRYGEVTNLSEELLSDRKRVLTVPGIGKPIINLNEIEKRNVRKILGELKFKARQNALANGYHENRHCYKKSGDNYSLVRTAACKSSFEPLFNKFFSEEVLAKGMESSKKSKLMLASRPWLGEHSGAKLDPSLLINGLKQRVNHITGETKALQEASLDSKRVKTLLFVPSIVDGIVEGLEDKNEKQKVCQIYQSLLNSNRRIQLGKNIGLGLVALVSVPVCLLSSGPACVGTVALGAATDSILWRSAYKELQKAHTDYYSGLITTLEFEEVVAKNSARRFTAFASGLGPILGVGAWGVKAIKLTPRAFKSVHGPSKIKRKETIRRLLRKLGFMPKRNQQQVKAIEQVMTLPGNDVGKMKKILENVGVSPARQVEILENGFRESRPWRSIGVEIEFDIDEKQLGLLMDDIEKYLQRSGALNTKKANGGLSISYRLDGEVQKINIVDDGTVTVEEIGRVGKELVSPILKTEKERDVFFGIVDILKNSGAKSNSKAGLHIHVGKDGLGGRQILQMAKDFTDYQDQIVKSFRTLPTRSYTQPIDSQLVNEALKDVELPSSTGKSLFDSLHAFRRGVLDKYQILNISGKYDATVEFRLFNSTLDVDSVKFIADLSESLLEASVRRDPSYVNYLLSVAEGKRKFNIEELASVVGSRTDAQDIKTVMRTITAEAELLSGVDSAESLLAGAMAGVSAFIGISMELQMLLEDNGI